MGTTVINQAPVAEIASHRDNPDTYGELREEFVARMESEGKKVLVPENDQLFIDIDTVEDYQRFVRACEVFKANGKEVTVVTDTPSTSGGIHRHIICNVSGHKMFTDKERILFQSLLGSDNVREILSFIRWDKGDQYPTLFVE